jgi:hypothetical protein
MSCFPPISVMAVNVAPNFQKESLLVFLCGTQISYCYMLSCSYSHFHSTECASAANAVCKSVDTDNLNLFCPFLTCLFGCCRSEEFCLLGHSAGYSTNVVTCRFQFPTTHCYITDGSTFPNHRCENLSSYILPLYLLCWFRNGSQAVEFKMRVNKQLMNFYYYFVY